MGCGLPLLAKWGLTFRVKGQTQLAYTPQFKWEELQCGSVPTLTNIMSRYSERQGHQQNLRRPPAFGNFLDFLTEGQVLDRLQTVVEQATERVAAMKTEAGVPLVDLQDPVEMPSSRHRSRAKPSINTVHRHRARPTLCAGRPNNYPSCSSSMSDSHSSITAGWLGSHSQDSDLGARGMGSLPPMKDKLLLEKNLKRLLRLENKGVRSGAITKTSRGWA